MTREPLIIRGAIVAAVTALIHVGVVLGILHIDPAAEVAVGTAIDLIGTAVLVVWTRGAVTPVADPRIDEDVIEPSDNEDEISVDAEAAAVDDPNA